MIFDKGCRLEAGVEQGIMQVVERDTVRSLLRLVPGLFFMSFGGLILLLFVTGGAPKPYDHPLTKWILGWMFLLMLFLGMGLLPFLYGLGLIVTRRRYLANISQRWLKSQITLGGTPIWTRAYPLEVFTGIAVRQEWMGVFGKHPCVVVSCCGPKINTKIAAFEQTLKAEALAETMAAYLGFPVVHDLPAEPVS